MLAFEISLNGKKLCIAGIGDDGVLTATVNWVAKGNEGDLFLQTGGIAAASDQHLRWIRQKPLQVNDEVQIRIIETAQADEPLHRQRDELPKGRHIAGIIGPY